MRLRGANQLANNYIGGITLTITDISEQRALERDVLTAANQERLRLAGDIHDGLGQELSGIALMLQSLRNSPTIGESQQQTHLRTISSHVAQVIRGARDLARGLSPVPDGEKYQREQISDDRRKAPQAPAHGWRSTSIRCSMTWPSTSFPPITCTG